MGKIIQTVFPSLLPAIAVTQRAALSTAGLRIAIRGRSGEYIQFYVVRKDGVRIFTSRVYHLPDDFPEIVRITVPQVRAGYTVWFTYIDYPNHSDVSYLDFRRHPFYFEKKKNPDGSPKNALIIIRGKGSKDLRHTLKIMRMRSRRNYVPKPRREWHPLMFRRQNLVQTSSVPTWNYTNGSGSSGTANYTSFTRSWGGGVITPNFKVRKKAGTLPINPYSMTMEHTNDGGFVIDTWFSSGTGTYTTQGGLYQSKFGTAEFGQSPGAPATSSSLDFRAQRKLREKIGPSNNLAQDFLQFGQTTSLFANTAQRIAAALHDTRRGNFAGAASSLFHSVPPKFRRGKAPSLKNSLADNWLAFQYGWKPLLDDLLGSMDSLARLNLASVEVYTARSSAQFQDSVKTKLFLNVQGAPVCGTQIQTTELTTRYGIRYQIDNHLKQFLAQTGFANPVNLAWEVLPYSFVVDWFLPIGPWLESFSTWDGLSFLDGWKATVSKVTTTWAVGYSGQMFPLDPTSNQMCSYSGSCSRETISYVRTKLSSFPTSPIPSFKNPIGTEHALNALALLTNAFYPHEGGFRPHS